MKIGGNYAKVDIYGITETGGKIACQVSYTNNKKMIQKKINSLLSFNSDIYICFTLKNNIQEKNVEIINIERVFNEFKEDSFYANFLYELIES